MANWLKILLFGGGVAVAGIGTAYLSGALDPWFEREQPIVAALPDAERITEPAALQVEGEDEAGGPAIATDDDSAQAADGDDLIVPAFDIVRVEPDGSMVIAGRAAPDATVEVLTGTRVIASVKAGADGDFAAVLDAPLAPGDYQIVLRSTTDDNVVVTSVETAIVSIPEATGGQVLALVEEPGSPSRLITVPEATEALPLEPEEEADVAEASEQSLSETAAAEVSEGAAAEATAEGESEDVSEAAVAEVTPDSQQPAESEIADAATNGGAEERVIASGEAASSEVTEVEAPVQPVEEAETVMEPEAGQDVAALQESGQDGGAAPAPAPAPAGDALVFVEAVEIDGNTVFVAGYAEPGRFVRVYANEILLGEVRVSEAGRFLIEAEIDLPVGDYIIRADLLGSDGSVVARAAVPFEREPGETMAAVAPRAPVAQPFPEEPAQAAEEDPSVDMAEGDEGQEASEVAAAPGDEDGEATEMAAGSQAPGVTEPEGQVEAAAAGDVPADEPADTAETAAEPATGETVQAELPDEASETEERMEAAAEPVLSPALERVDGAVIIRRGDNLWRISRRVYGQGVRFSTIYLANQDQIRNPDLIWPGQVFTVPAETAEGEAADLEALGEQAVDPSQVPGEIIR